MILKEKTKIELGVDFDSCKVYTEIFCQCKNCGKNVGFMNYKVY